MTMNSLEQVREVDPSPGYTMQKDSQNLDPSYSAPEGILVTPEAVEQYAESAGEHIEGDMFGALKYDEDSLATELTDAIDQVEEFEGDFNEEGTIVYNFGLAIGSVGDSITENQPGEPDYEQLASDIAQAGARLSSRVNFGEKIMAANVEPIEEYLVEGSKNSEKILE